MRSSVRQHRQAPEWREWFAWRPVIIWAKNDYVWAWWETILRKDIYSPGYDGTSHRVEYRLKS